MEFGFNRKLYLSQEKFIKDAINVIDAKEVGIFSSPTGTGKTLSLLCVAANYINIPEDDLYSILNSVTKTKIYYCSRTHSQLSQAINELKNNINGYNSVILGSRKIYCINKDVNKYLNIDILNENCKKSIRNDSCKFYKNFYYNQQILDIEDTIKLGHSHEFCPYYFSKNKSQECDIVFLPYNLLFNKKIRESLDIDIKDKILIIDEAHNIYDAVIEINSASIRWEELRNIAKLVDLEESIKLILKSLLNFQKVNSEKCYTILKFLVEAGLCDINMIEVSENIEKKKLAQKNDMKSIFELSKLLHLLTFSDEDGRIFVDKYKIRFTCLNPKMYFEEFKDAQSIIFAGGTMEPISNLKGVFPNIKYFTYPSVNDNFLPIIITETSNKKPINLNFLERDHQIDDVVNTLVALTNPILSGGIVIFVPSKSFLSQIRSSSKLQNFKRKVYFDDEIKFDSFKANPEILISIMGGILSEGINFSDDICRLLIIVGVPFPTMSLEFQERCKSNKDYGSNIAMKTVNQTIGRALRHKDDYAAIVLLDVRFMNLKDKLSPWILQKVQICHMVEGLIKINKFLKSQVCHLSK